MKRTSFKNPHAEDIRLRGLYRRLILEGKIRLRYKSLMGLIGPDCAYHLYKFDKENNAVIMCLKSKKGGTVMAKIVTYECGQCGCEVVVTEMPETQLSPLYCCGIEMEGVSAAKKSKPKKKASKKKTAKKKVVKKKKKGKK